MEVTKPELKSLIWNIVNLTDEVDEKEKPVVRTSFKKEHVKGVMQIKQKILDQMEVGYYEGDKKLDDVLVTDITWIKLKERNNEKILVERHSELPVEFNNKMIDALKYYYNLREEIPLVNEVILEELELLIK